MRTGFLTIVLTAFLTGSLARVSGAQDNAAGGSPTRSTLTGVYSNDQAARGEKTYNAKCTSCHAPNAYTGEAFSRAWATLSAFDLFELIRTTMPNDNPGSLSRQQYAEIVAYLFKLNGFPAGKQPLPTEKDELKRVKIEIGNGES